MDCKVNMSQQRAAIKDKIASLWNELIAAQYIWQDKLFLC